MSRRVSSRGFQWTLGLVLLAGVGVLGLLRWRAERAEPVAGPPVDAQGAARPTRSGESAPEGFIGVVIPEGSVDIASRVEGRLASIKVQVGDEVKQGAVLASLDTQVLRKELAIAQAETQSALADQEIAALAVTEAQARLERREDPKQLSLGALSVEELNTSRYELRVAVAKLEAAKARVQERQASLERLQQDVDDTQLRAPFDGVVAGRYLDAGAQLKPGQLLLHLLRKGIWRVRFAVPEEQLRGVAAGRRVRIAFAEQGLSVPGTVLTVAPEVDAAARVILVLAQFEQLPGKGMIPSGAMVRVFVEPEEQQLGKSEP